MRSMSLLSFAWRTSVRLRCLVPCVPLLALPSAADDVLTLRGELPLTNRVVALSATNVVLSGGRSVDLKDVSRIAFDAAPVVAQTQTLLLTDGTRLSGTLQELNQAQVKFRSTALGPLVLPLERVAAVCFAGGGIPDNLQTPKKDHVLAVLTTGIRHQGQLFAASREGLILRTESGLPKIDFAETAYVSFRKADSRTAVVLRNGDRLNMPIQWSGASFSVSLDTNPPAILTLEALKEIHYP